MSRVRRSRVVDETTHAINDFLERRSDAYLIGEDLVDPYGGAFKVTKGLSTRFPGRVLSTPISEAAIVGVATGLAIRGCPCVVEIMFGDFLTLCFDQLLNHATKFPWMYNDQVRVPLVVRTPMGGRRGYGPTHSQSLEKYFCGIPGLEVFAIDQYADIRAIYADAFSRQSPTLIVENKTLYARQVEASLPQALSPDLVFVTYGGCVELCVEAASVLAAQEELVASVLPIRRLSPFDSAALKQAIGACKRVVVVEEGTEGWGFSAQVALALVGQSLRFEYVAAVPLPIPSSREWEQQFLPSVTAILEAAKRTF
jgi:pyruvate/2-oxoglutarate/acetoin dehydrogenase E1 component